MFAINVILETVNGRCTNGTLRIVLTFPTENVAKTVGYKTSKLSYRERCKNGGLQDVQSFPTENVVKTVGYKTYKASYNRGCEVTRRIKQETF